MPFVAIDDSDCPKDLNKLGMFGLLDKLTESQNFLIALVGHAQAYEILLACTSQLSPSQTIMSYNESFYNHYLRVIYKCCAANNQFLLTMIKERKCPTN